MGAFPNNVNMSIDNLTPVERIHLACLALGGIDCAPELSRLYGRFFDHLDDLANDLRTASPRDLIAPPKRRRSSPCRCR